MEDELDFTNIKKHFDSIIKRDQEIQSAMQQSYDNEIALMKNQHHSELEDVRTQQSEKNRKNIFEKESEIAHLKNLHNLKVDRIKTEYHNKLEKIKSDHKTEITDVKTQHKTESDQVDFDFTKEIEKIKQQNINQIKQLKQQHQCELVEIRREKNAKPKVTKISSEETIKTSDK